LQRATAVSIIEHEYRQSLPFHRPVVTLAMILLRLLGGIALTVDGDPVSGRAAQRHRLALLALLAAAGKDPVSRAKLTDYLWPEAGPRGRQLLSNSVHLIRRAMGEDVLLGTTDALRLNPDRVDCDLHRFEAAVEEGDMKAAVDLYRGPFLDGFFLADTAEFEAWVDQERDRCSRAYIGALESLAGERESAGDFAAAAVWWRRVRDVDPLASQTVLRLMRALEAAGEVEHAVQCGRAYESRIRAELEIEPDRAVAFVLERLIRERALDRTAVTPSTEWSSAAGTLPTPPGAGSQRAAPSPAAHATGPVSTASTGSPASAARSRFAAFVAVGLIAGIVSGAAVVGALRLLPDARSADLPLTPAALGGGADATVRAGAESPVLAGPAGGEGDGAGLPGGHSALTRNVAAYELYRSAIDPRTFRSDSAARVARDQLIRATALDPAFAAAHARLAGVTLRVRRSAQPGDPRRELLAAAERAAMRALALDDSLAESHMAAALVRKDQFDLEAAEAHLRRAVSLAPDAGVVREKLAEILVWTGRFDEAREEAERAVALDPLSAAAHAEVARVLVVSGRCEEALARLDPLADLEPPLLRAAPLAAQCLAQAGRWDEALAWLDRMGPNRLPPGDALVGYVLARAGREAEALEIHERLLGEWRRGAGDSFAVALSMVGFGRIDEAFLWLDRSIDDGTLPVTSQTNILEPAFDEVRRDPRFASLARRIGLGSGEVAGLP
jgi:DNA-binding SARP family transcriptional activator